MALSKVVKILLVEDNPGDARLVKEAFAEMWLEDDYRLAHVTNLADALDHIHNFPLDAILLDLNLPDSTGISTFYSLNSQARHIPVLLLSGVGLDETAQELVRAGAQEFLVKGNINFHHLVSSVSFAIERKRFQDQLTAEQERIRALMDQAPDGIMVLDSTGNILDANPSLGAIVGYSTTELKKMHASNLLCEGEVGKMAQVLASPEINRTQIFECHWLSKNKQVIQVEVSSKFLFDGRIQAFVRDISLRKQIEQDLAETNALNSNLVQNLPFYINILDENCKVVYTNNKAANETDANSDQEHCCDPALDGKSQCSSCPKKKGLTVGSLEKVIITDRKGKTLEVVNIGILHKGKPALLKIFHDISEQKDLENKLSEMVTRANFHDHNTPMAIIEFDKTKHFTKWSDQAEKMFGWKEEEVLGLYHTEVNWVVEKDIAQVEAAADKVMSGKYPFYINTNQNLKKDGTVLTCNWYTSVLTDKAGEVTSVRSYVVDATERTEAEKKLRESEMLFSAIFYGSPLSITVRDKGGRLLAYNNAWHNIYGYSDEAIAQEQKIGIITADFAGSEPDYLLHKKEITQAYRTGNDLLLPNVKFTTRDGKHKWLSLAFWPIMDDDGKVEKVITLSQDVTEQHIAHQAIQENSEELERVIISRTAELRQANNELERVAKMKDEFLASMSHELRTPLTGILGLTEAMLLDVYGPLNEKQKGSVVNIELSGRHLLSLISDILDLSKINASMLDLSFGNVSLDNICQSSMQMVRPQSIKKQVDITYEANPRGIVLRADQRRLKQAVMNLLNNAIKFTPSHGRVGIETVANEAQAMVEISVWDEGIGISEADQARLFQPFVQLDSSLSRQYEGTGLGLSLTRKFAELHGGSIRVESTLNKGSRFTICLPYIKQDSDDITDVIKLPDEIKMALVVDKDEREAIRVTDLLSSIGIKSQVSLDPDGGLGLAVGIKPDLILVNGAVLKIDPKWIAKLKQNENTHSIPLILIGQHQMANAEADALLNEPFGQKQLHSVVSQAIQLNYTKRGENAAYTFRRITNALRQPVVFLTDDDLSTVQVISDFLVKQNFKINTFSSGQDLLSMLEEKIPDVLMLDIQMPKMDGFEVIRAIRSHYDIKVRNLPILAITAMAMKGDQERCIAAGANAYITKPLKLSDVVDTLRLITNK